MPEAKLAVVKENRQNFSKCSIEWLEHVSQSEGIHIRHACNGGEYQVGGKYYVDGYHKHREQCISSMAAIGTDVPLVLNHKQNIQNMAKPCDNCTKRPKRSPNAFASLDTKS